MICWFINFFCCRIFLFISFDLLFLSSCDDHQSQLKNEGGVGSTVTNDPNTPANNDKRKVSNSGLRQQNNTTGSTSSSHTVSGLLVSAMQRFKDFLWLVVIYKNSVWFLVCHFVNTDKSFHILMWPSRSVHVNRFASMGILLEVTWTDCSQPQKTRSR